MLQWVQAVARELQKPPPTVVAFVLIYFCFQQPSQREAVIWCFARACDGSCKGNDREGPLVRDL